MAWRWVIRGIGIALLSLCATAWVGSYFECIFASYGSTAVNGGAGLAGGEFFIAFDRPALLLGWRVRHWRYDAAQKARMRRWYESMPVHALGFAWQSDSASVLQRDVMIPLWFPAALSAGLLWLVWRKTHRRASGAFPVEVQGKEPARE